MKNNICVDVWGGENSCDHLARYMLAVDDALILAKHEILAGFLVNIRCDPSWGIDGNFDTRIKKETP